VPSEPPPIDTVVFDLGNVLVRWDRRLLYEQLIDDPDELDRFLDQVLTLEVNAELDRGRPLAEVTAALAARHPEHEALIDAFRMRWLETLGPVIEPTVGILEELAAGGVRLLALSNWGRETFALSEPRLSFLHFFEGIVISGREGVVKPDPAIFTLLCERHGVAPATAVFVDDSAANVATAAGLGFRTVHFHDPAQCRTELAALGLDLTAGSP
jgi:2-haloacid dehalogenase